MLSVKCAALNVKTQKHKIITKSARKSHKFLKHEVEVIGLLYRTIVGIIFSREPRNKQNILDKRNCAANFFRLFCIFCLFRILKKNKRAFQF
jgi:hypothetical protein